VTSTTGLEVPPFPGEAVYHASKACQEAFTNVLRTELVGTDIKVLALRPGVVATNFHEQRYDFIPFFIISALRRSSELTRHAVLDTKSRATILSCLVSSLLLRQTLRKRPRSC